MSPRRAASRAASRSRAAARRRRRARSIYSATGTTTATAPAAKDTPQGHAARAGFSDAQRELATACSRRSTDGSGRSTWASLNAVPEERSGRPTKTAWLAPGAAGAIVVESKRDGTRRCSPRRRAARHVRAAAALQAGSGQTIRRPRLREAALRQRRARRRPLRKEWDTDGDGTVVARRSSRNAIGRVALGATSRAEIDGARRPVRYGSGDIAALRAQQDAAARPAREATVAEVQAKLEKAVAPKVKLPAAAARGGRPGGPACAEKLALARRLATNEAA